MSRYKLKQPFFSFFFLCFFLHEIELRMKIWCLASNSMSNLIKLCSLSYSFSFSCFQYNTGVSVKKLDLFHIRLLFECFLSRITFLGGFGRERHIKPLEMKSRVSHKIEQRMKIWCLASNSLWNLMKLCSLSYSFSFADFQCNTCFSEKKLLLFHISLNYVPCHIHPILSFAYWSSFAFSMQYMCFCLLFEEIWQLSFSYQSTFWVFLE